MRSIFKKLLHRQAMLSHPKWQEKIFYIPFRKLLYTLAYEEYNWPILKKIFKHHKKLFLSIFGLIICFYGTYIAGIESTKNRISFLSNTLSGTYFRLNEASHDRDSLQLSLNDLFSSRHYKEFIIFKETGVKIPKEVQDVDIDLMIQMAQEYQVPMYIMFNVIQKESGFKWAKNGQIITSSAGAKGYMQLMPETYASIAKTLKLGNMNVENNLRVGAYYLSKLYKRYNFKEDRSNLKTWKLPLAAYNAGPDNIINNQVPNFTETQDYVTKILPK